MMDSLQMNEYALACKLCLNKFIEPKILSCFHRFCEPCLDGWVKGQHTRDKYGRTGFPCPECSEFIEVINDRNRPEKWAAAIRTDDYLKNMISYFELRNEQNNHRPLQKREHARVVHTDKDCDLFCSDCCKAFCHFDDGSLHKRSGQMTTLTKVAQDHRAALEIRLKQATDEKDAALKMKVSLDKCWKEYDAKKRVIEAEIKRWGQATRQSIEEEENKLLHQLNEEFSQRKNQVRAKISPFLENIHRSSEKLDSALSGMKTKSGCGHVYDNSVSDALTEFEKRENTTMKDCQEVVEILPKASINVDNYSLMSILKPHITFVDGDHEKILHQSSELVVKN